MRQVLAWWGIATFLAMSWASTVDAQTCYGGCEAASRHPYDWCWVNTFPQTLRSPVSEDLSAEADLYCSAFNAQPPSYGEKSTITQCGPVQNLALTSSGGSWAGLTLSGHIITKQVSTGYVIYDGPSSWGFAQCGCNDSRNINLIKTGVDNHCYCSQGYQWEASIGACVRYLDRYHDKNECSGRGPGVGRAIFPMSGAERTSFALSEGAQGSIEVSYDSRRMVASIKPAMSMNASAPPSFGPLWESAVHKKLVIQTSNTSSRANILAARGNGSWVSFRPDAVDPNKFLPDADVADRLVYYFDDRRGLWLYRYTHAAARSIELYDSSGSLLHIYGSDGTLQSYGYVSGRIETVQDHFGRVARFEYETPVDANLSARIKSFTSPGGRKTSFGYSAAGYLERVTWPDSFSRRFVYEHSTFPWALTGFFDERDVRIATMQYDPSGRAFESVDANGLNRYRVDWGTPPSWQVSETYDSSAGVIWRDHFWTTPQAVVLTLPNGSSSTMEAVDVQGTPRVSSMSQAAGSGCAASSSSQLHDGNGNVVRSDDFNGNRSCMAYEAGRNLQTVKVEGLSTAADCAPVLAPAATLPVGSRKVTTQWHPDWALPVRVAEPGRITTYVYHGQDPLNTGAKASCAGQGVTLPTLPDGKPLALLCTRVEQATTDLNGGLGFGAAADTLFKVRQWAYTYNQFGQVMTSNGPRGADDVNDTTTYEYWTDTSLTGVDPDAVGHTMGDLRKVTNALGQATEYTLYNKAGKPLESKDANGVVTVYAYDARGRLLSSKVGTETTQYDYYPTGLLKKLTQPDGVSYVQYTYNDAHQLVKASDQLGNAVEYTPDDYGNMTQELVRDAGQVQRRVLLRSIDALGRVQQLTGRQ